MNILKERWAVWDAHIQTELLFNKKFDNGVVRSLPVTVALNVGADVARHIVYLHNQNLIVCRGHTDGPCDGRCK